MSERETYPAGVPCWIDALTPDPKRVSEFYRAIFGWEFAGPAPMAETGSEGEYYVARLRGRDVAGIGSAPSAQSQGPGWNTYVRVESAERTAVEAKAAGGEVLSGPFDALPAGRMAVLADPGGAPFCVWEPRERQGAELVNEPGAWSMSFLNARDTASAADFYRRLFGWEAEPFEFAEMRAFLFRLPGFVGGEPQQPVPRDVVATMMPIDAGEGEAGPAHWGVDLWIDDTDRAAAKASELGGGVIVAPYDNAAFRSAVLADPDGARFGVSQLTAGV